VFRHKLSPLTAAAAGIAAVGLTAASATAINTYNAEPAPERTEVGAFMVLWDRDDDGSNERFDWYCSGTMVDDDTYLTAAHCTVDWSADAHFYVSLEEDVQSLLDQAAADGLDGAETAAWFLESGYAVEGDAAWDQAYPGNSADSHDIGVVDFADRSTTPADVWSFTPATLPTAGQLSTMSPRQLDATDWLVAGYGTSEAARGPGGHTHPGGGVRMKAAVGFDALNKTWVRLAMREPLGYGGACYGDSGGPNYATLGGKLVLVATTITGDGPCYATNVAYRLDAPSARTFLAPYVDLP
jgi:hypothetical protein